MHPVMEQITSTKTASSVFLQIVEVVMARPIVDWPIGRKQENVKRVALICYIHYCGSFRYKTGLDLLHTLVLFSQIFLTLLS